MSYVATTKKCLPRIFVRPSVRHITDTKNPCVLVLTRCHVTDINHVLTPCHVIEINYVDRGVAARQFFDVHTSHITVLRTVEEIIAWKSQNACPFFTYS
jgi:hypothetical protein